MGPDGRCAACGTYQQQPHTAAQPHPAPGPYGYGYPQPYPYPAAVPGPVGGLPVGGVDLRRGVRIALNVLLGVVALLLMLHIAAIGQQRGVIQDILSDGHVSFSASDAVDDADSFAAAMTALSFLGMAATAVLWVIWFRRVRLNAEVFAPGTHRFGSGWAVGSWFTPVVNLWFPKQMANDIYRASAPGGPQSAPKGLLNAWWVLWIAANVLSMVGDGMSSVASRKLERPFPGSDWRSNVELLNSSLAVSGFSVLLLLADTVLALLVVRQLTRMQEQRALAGPLAMPPAPPFVPSPAASYAAPPVPTAAPFVPPAVPPYGAPAGGAPYGPPPQQNPFGAGPAAS
ncbi:DUF4328 domain-containing protein [Streptomyces hesseae]|uniref:DUF4328 domain-containing protein n=1 Tax=Streptomyces hesseae TaxID=3075519 RepID=A0ABU2SRS8_9ACTN|nr:DUF4328 domain-containing protein [Streptomyces sp. DSM 40473]MDT0450614.1 DUF4328 domain-containing protein [Streptomyces sp. DSM 40473]